MDVFLELNRLSWESGKGKAIAGPNVCMGKEWHRFPSNFFIPHQ